MDACPTSGSAMAYTASPMLEDLLETSAAFNKAMKAVSMNSVRQAFGLGKEEAQKVVAALRDLEEHTDGLWMSRLTEDAAALAGVKATAGFRPTAVVCFVVRTGTLVHKLLIIDVHDQAYKAYNALLTVAVTAFRAQMREQFKSHADTFLKHEMDTAALLQAFAANGLAADNATKGEAAAAGSSTPAAKTG